MFYVGQPAEVMPIFVRALYTLECGSPTFVYLGLSADDVLRVFYFSRGMPTMYIIGNGKENIHFDNIILYE